MRIFLSRSIYDSEDKIVSIIKELETEGHFVYDGVKVYQAAAKRGADDEAACQECFRCIDECDLCLIVPCFTPGVQAEYAYAKRTGKKRRILRRILR